jgi:hypothetical protein
MRFLVHYRSAKDKYQDDNLFVGGSADGVEALPPDRFGRVWSVERADRTVALQFGVDSGTHPAVPLEVTLTGEDDQALYYFFSDAEPDGTPRVLEFGELDATPAAAPVSPAGPAYPAVVPVSPGVLPLPLPQVSDLFDRLDAVQTGNDGVRLGVDNLAIDVAEVLAILKADRTGLAQAATGFLASLNPRPAPVPDGDGAAVADLGSAVALHLDGIAVKVADATGRFRAAVPTGQSAIVRQLEILHAELIHLRDRYGRLATSPGSALLADVRAEVDGQGQHLAERFTDLAGELQQVIRNAVTAVAQAAEVLSGELYSARREVFELTSHGGALT